MVNWPPFISAAQMGHQRAIRGDGHWIKGALRAGMKAGSYSEPPYAHWGYRVRGVPRKMAFTQCTSVSNNGISMPSVFFLEGFDLQSYALLCPCPVCDTVHAYGSLKGWKQRFCFMYITWRSLTVSGELEIFMQIFSLPGSVPNFSSSSSLV